MGKSVFCRGYTLFAISVLDVVINSYSKEEIQKVSEDNKDTEFCQETTRTGG